MKKLVTEFIGTFFLVFTIGCASTTNSAVIALAIGSVLMVMIYAGGHVSGAHYNPAVSLAVFVRGGIKMAAMLQYWVAQLLGGLLGALVSYYITNGQESSITIARGEGYTPMVALVAETLATFALGYVVLNVATSKNTAGNSFYGMAIGFTVFAMAIALGPISGGAFNPAVGIGRDLADAIVGSAKSLDQVWVYVVGPLAGGLLAGWAFKMLNPDDVAQ